MTTSARIDLPADLGLDARYELLGLVSRAIDGTDTEVEIGCLAAYGNESSVIGTLATIARSAHAKGVRVVLVGASLELRQQLRAANVEDRFEFRY